MNAGTLFGVTFYLAVPFWALMILAPGWSVTRTVIRSPWIAAVPLAVYVVLMVPDLPLLWSVMSRPDLGTLRDFLGSPQGAAAIWAHLIGFDLFVGRWMYFESRERGIHPLLMAPVLLLTILLSPFGLLAFLVIRLCTPQPSTFSRTQPAPTAR
jgi:hypothetical protein